MAKMIRCGSPTGQPQRQVVPVEYIDASYPLTTRGPYVTDKFTGAPLNEERAVRQRGGWVMAERAFQEYDIPSGDRRDGDDT